MIDDTDPEVLTTAEATRRVLAAAESPGPILENIEILADALVGDPRRDPESRGLHVRIEVKGTLVSQIDANMRAVAGAIDGTPGVQVSNAARDAPGSPRCVLAVAYYAKNNRRT